tara:strand:+ start:15 stop:443 length:429 start_codon:yes stop_codon:yes gene_type:complete
MLFENNNKPSKCSGRLTMNNPITSSLDNMIEQNKPKPRATKKISFQQLQEMVERNIIDAESAKSMIEQGIASGGSRVAGGKGLVVLQKLNSINEEDRTVDERRAIKLIERLNKIMAEINTHHIIDVLQEHEQISKVSANWNK